MTVVAAIAVFFLGAVALRLAWPSPSQEMSPGLESVIGGGIQQEPEAEEGEGRLGFRSSQTPRV